MDSSKSSTIMSVSKRKTDKMEHVYSCFGFFIPMISTIAFHWGDPHSLDNVKSI